MSFAVEERVRDALSGVLDWVGSWVGGKQSSSPHPNSAALMAAPTVEAQSIESLQRSWCCLRDESMCGMFKARPTGAASSIECCSNLRGVPPVMPTKVTNEWIPMAT